MKKKTRREKMEEGREEERMNHCHIPSSEPCPSSEPSPDGGQELPSSVSVESRGLFCYVDGLSQLPIDMVPGSGDNLGLEWHCWDWVILVGDGVVGSPWVVSVPVPGSSSMLHQSVSNWALSLSNVRAHASW